MTVYYNNFLYSLIISCHSEQDEIPFKFVFESGSSLQISEVVMIPFFFFFKKPDVTPKAHFWAVLGALLIFQLNKVSASIVF